MLSVSCLKEIAARWTAKRPELGARLEKAVEIALMAVVPESSGTFTVFSVANTLDVYKVRLAGKASSCTCHDAVKRKSRCKHQLAAALFTVANQ